MAKVAPRTPVGLHGAASGRPDKDGKNDGDAQESYSVYGFAPLDTPVIESAEVLLAKGGGETGKADIQINKGRQRPALRF